MTYQYKGTKPATATVGHGAKLKLKPCGTPAGYKRHKREDTPICDPCRIAFNHEASRINRQRYARRKGGLTRGPYKSYRDRQAPSNLETNPR